MWDLSGSGELSAFQGERGLEWEQKGSVYFKVFTTLGTATERKRRKAEKNYIKLRSDRKAPKGQKDAERAKTVNITPNMTPNKTASIIIPCPTFICCIQSVVVTVLFLPELLQKIHEYTT